MKKEAITHGVLEDLANRNDNWDKLDGVPEKVDLLIESKADKVEVDASLELKADKTYVDNQDAALTAQLAEKANKAYKVNPTSPTLLNNFEVGSLKGCIYYQSDDGTVCVQGSVANTSLVLGATIFQFPVGLRPLNTLVFTGVRSDVPDLVIYVTSSGEVIYMRGGTNGVNVTWASLSNIRFKAGV